MPQDAPPADSSEPSAETKAQRPEFVVPIATLILTDAIVSAISAINPELFRDIERRLAAVREHPLGQSNPKSMELIDVVLRSANSATKPDDPTH